MNTTVIHTENTAFGWYASDEPFDLSNASWNDRGNGPELLEHDDIHGPFDTEEEAEEWVRTYLQELGEDI